MLVRSDLPLRQPPWTGPLLALAGAAVVALVYHHPAAERGLAEGGILFVALSYHLVLPLLGLGCALALTLVEGRRLAAVAAVGLFVLGLAIGVYLREAAVTQAAAALTALNRLLLQASSLACLAVGLVLAVPRGCRDWLLQPASVILGTILTVQIQMNSPQPHQPSFIAGATGAACWLVAVVALTVKGLLRPWFATASRILGSWLIAIGLLLGGATLIPRRAPDPGLLLLPPPTEAPTDRLSGTGKTGAGVMPSRHLLLPPGFNEAE